MQLLSSDFRLSRESIKKMANIDLTDLTKRVADVDSTPDDLARFIQSKETKKYFGSLEFFLEQENPDEDETLDIRLCLDFAANNSYNPPLNALSKSTSTVSNLLSEIYSNLNMLVMRKALIRLKLV